MGKIICVSNHKGGVGKTTSSINIGAGLNKLKKRVLLVDLDPQANLTDSLGVSNPERTIYKAIIGIDNIPHRINISEGLDLVASDLELATVEAAMDKLKGKKNLLKRILEPLRSDYDYIVIDCPPSLGLLTINALMVSDAILIPLQAHYLALHGLNKLINAVRSIREDNVVRIFVTLYDSRKILHKDVATSIDTLFPGKVLKTKIRENVALAEAPTQGKDVFRYAPKSYGSEDYLALCNEIIKLK